MNPWKVPFALFAFLGIVAVLPGWFHFVNTYGSELQMEARFLAQFTLPALALLFLGSWFRPSV